ncbi:hypothetical protein PRIPAC_96114 [Pristionchus pacificus]|uniref:Uncharacterized protein n=1 Tax=Pristionchus pacificus TaxID=54126 RepID=A0A454XRZ1_PRIPA|nr:hypothetical protein PRIPAC_96114 [Pristionchus pacificus]|eukprot:PDM63629.1 hypothetical protein PRIPAC_49602 [Pristionchus pacificus]
MTRYLLVLILLTGVATAWNYKTGYDSHPCNLKNVWVKRSESTEELPQPPVREKAPTISYIHKRNSASLRDVETTVLPQPTSAKTPRRL